jgi:hypothetical protein
MGFASATRPILCIVNTQIRRTAQTELVEVLGVQVRHFDKLNANGLVGNPNPAFQSNLTKREHQPEYACHATE